MTRHERFRIFVPTTLITAAAAEVLESAEDVEIVYGVPSPDGGARAWPTDADERAEYERQMNAALQAALPHVHALHGIGLARQIPVTADMLRQSPDLLVVFVPSAGIDSIDLGAATDHGIAVVHAPGNNYPAVSEHAVALMLALTRKVALTDRMAHANGHQRASIVELGFPTIVHGKTLALVAYGFIGREVGRICRDGFGMRVLVYDPYFNPTEAERLGVEMCSDLHDMLRQADLVSIHAPLTEESRGLIGWDELVAMKPSAFLINTARGPVVDTDALVRALREGEIAGAGLDVTHPEPLPVGHPLFGFDNVVLTPHSAGAAPELTPRGGRVAARAALGALRGETPGHRLANPDVWPRYIERLRAMAATPLPAATT